MLLPKGESEVVDACVLHERHLAAHLRAEPLIEYREPLDVARLKPLTGHVVEMFIHRALKQSERRMARYKFRALLRVDRGKGFNRFDDGVLALDPILSLVQFFNQLIAVRFPIGRSDAQCIARFRPRRRVVALERMDRLTECMHNDCFVERLLMNGHIPVLYNLRAYRLPGLLTLVRAS